MPPRPKPLAVRFWSKVQRSSPEECWPWIGGRLKTGYGLFAPDGHHRTTAHRIAFFLAHGRLPIPEGLHTCDNPPCCNPAHIVEGTQAENLADMRAKGRAGDCRLFGEEHGRCKLTDEQVRALRALYRAGGRSQDSLARAFGIAQSHVSRIIRGENRVAA